MARAPLMPVPAITPTKFSLVPLRGTVKYVDRSSPLYVLLPIVICVLLTCIGASARRVFHARLLSALP